MGNCLCSEKNIRKIHSYHIDKMTISPVSKTSVETIYTVNGKVKELDMNVLLQKNWVLLLVHKYGDDVRICDYSNYQDSLTVNNLNKCPCTFAQYQNIEHYYVIVDYNPQEDFHTESYNLYFRINKMISTNECDIDFLNNNSKWLNSVILDFLQ